MLELNKSKINNSNVIRSINDDQHAILKNIITLYCPDGIHADVCYSIGNFYNNEIKDPKFKFDVNPQSEGVIESDCRKLPLENNSLNNLIFDPPFLFTATKESKSMKNPKKGSNLMHKRFSSFYPAKALWDFYTDSLKEFYRVLKKDGILIVKCQDTVSGGHQYMSHVHIINEAEKLGLYCKDIFILFVKNRMISYPGGKQIHARKFHSYFLVFEKWDKPVVHIKNNN